MPSGSRDVSWSRYSIVVNEHLIIIGQHRFRSTYKQQIFEVPNRFVAEFVEIVVAFFPVAKTFSPSGLFQFVCEIRSRVRRHGSCGWRIVGRRCATVVRRRRPVRFVCTGVYVRNLWIHCLSVASSSSAQFIYHQSWENLRWWRSRDLNAIYSLLLLPYLSPIDVESIGSSKNPKPNWSHRFTLATDLVK